MRTDDDIRRALDLDDDRAALARLTALADDLAQLPTAPRATSGARRVVPLLAAAAAVVLVAGGGVALVRFQDRRGGESGGSTRLSAHQRRPVWNLRVARIAGFTTARVSASSIGPASGSTVTVSATDAKRPEQGVMTTCPLTFHACAQPSDPDVSDVTVDGRPGYFFPGRHVTRGSLTRAVYRAHPWRAALQDDRSWPDLTWDAGHHTTVFLEGTFGFDPHTRSYDRAATEKILLRIAAAVTSGHQDATHLPFELHGLPGRVAPERVAVQHGGACGEYGTGPRGSGDALGTVLTACRVRTGATRAVTVRAADRADGNRTNGYTRFEPDHPVVHDVGDGTSVVIDVEPGRRDIVSPATARRLAATADVSPRLGVLASWIVVG